MNDDLPPRPEEELAAAESYRLEQVSQMKFRLATPSGLEFLLTRRFGTVTGFPEDYANTHPDVVAEISREILAL